MAKKLVVELVTELEGVYPKPPSLNRVVRVAEELGNTIDLTEERVGV